MTGIAEPLDGPKQDIWHSVESIENVCSDMALGLSIEDQIE